MNCMAQGRIEVILKTFLEVIVVTEMKFRLNAQLELLDIEQEEMLDTLNY